MPLQRWVRLARTPKAFAIADQLRIIEHRIKTGEVSVEVLERDHAAWVEALRIQNRIHVFRD